MSIALWRQVLGTPHPEATVERFAGEQWSLVTTLDGASAKTLMDCLRIYGQGQLMLVDDEGHRVKVQLI